MAKSLLDGTGMTGAGTAEGYDRGTQFLYSCPSHPEIYKVSHLSWIWWCPLCGTKVHGPNAKGTE